MNAMLRREIEFKKINTVLLLIFAVLSIRSAVLGLKSGDGYAVFQAVLALAMFTFPSLITHFLHFTIPQDCRTIYYIFTFCTIVVGSSMYGYARIPYWDKVFHFFSGILISAAGLILCHMLFHSLSHEVRPPAGNVLSGCPEGYTLSGGRGARRILYLLFPFLFNLSAAALWEVYEYMLYILFGIDAVNNLTSGVNDTMQDIIVCLLGGILFTLSFWRALRKGTCGFVLNVCIHFFHMRGQTLDFRELGGM